MTARRLLLVWLVCLVVSSSSAAEGPVVNQSARKIPVAYQVDVVVVGGGTGAVSAAVAAAESGAKVFLAAPYPYLGDDMTATLRLWLEEGEQPQSPLAKRIFAVDSSAAAHPNSLEFTYQADLPGAGVHKDTSGRGLCDGRWGDPSTESVQYDGDVTITAELKQPQQLKEVRLFAYRRDEATSGGGGFDVQSVTFSASNDNKQWKQLAVVENKDADGPLVMLSTPVGDTARYIKVAVKKPANLKRVLLGEIEIVAAALPAVAKPSGVPPPPRPMHVKKVLDEALLGAGVEFLYSCYVTDVLRDAAGNPCGVVMANRAGRQAVVAKTIIDATDRAWVARMAGAEFAPYPAGAHTFQRVVIGGEVQSGQQMTARSVATPFRGSKGKVAAGSYEIIEYTLQLPMKDDSYASWMAADQKARTMTYHPDQQFTSDRLFEVPPDAVHGEQSASGPWQGVEKLPLGALRPAKVPQVYVLGGCADVARQQAEKLLRPLALIDLGARIGKAAAEQAKSLPAPKGVKLPGKTTDRPAAEGEVRELLGGVRPVPQQVPEIEQDATALPVLGRYDVVVIGGGTGGAPAGISAARQGAKTLVIEYLHGLGGVGTLGAISHYYWGNRVGFTATVEGGGAWVIEKRMEWWRKQLLEAGGEVWFGTIGCGAFVKDDQVVGAVVATPHGRGVVLAKAVIDATGNADVAAAAGAKCIYTDETEFGMQGTGLPGRRLGETYNNTDFTLVDETDMLDVWHVFVYSKNKYPDAFDHGKLIDTRERRRIVGELTITLLDEVNGRTYPDTVVQARSNFDSHGYTVDPYLLVDHPGHKGFNVYIPYRAMLPKGMEGVLVIGLGTSAHRDAVPLIRMQPDIQNQGYAAGVAAATAAKANTLLRNIDMRELQKHLVEIGNLPASVLTDRDSYPLPAEQVAAAVASIKEGQGIPVVLAQPEQSLPLLKKAYGAAKGKDKLEYAKVLAALGDGSGAEELLAEVRSAEKWDKGWNYKGMGQFGSALSPMDNSLVLLGRSRDRRAVPVILEKLKLLKPSDDFSHFRAVGLALESIGDPAAAQPLAELLALPGISGNAHSSVEIAKQRGAPGGTNAEQTRRESLRELMLARALYRCGDYNGVGKKILEEYTKDLRGHLARHAQAVLSAGPKN